MEIRFGMAFDMTRSKKDNGIGENRFPAACRENEKPIMLAAFIFLHTVI
jgi:hypothetical protein